MNKTILRYLRALALLAFFSSGPLVAMEIGGVKLPDNFTATDGTALKLNGAGVRSKFWIDLYVGSLYLQDSANSFEGVLNQGGTLSIQMDFVYSEIDSENMIKTWKAGFEKNQPADKLAKLQSRIDQFYGFFDKSAIKGDQYRFDYVPDQGTAVLRNGQQLGLLEGRDFRDALLAIWLGNYPADDDLKAGMLGLDD